MKTETSLEATRRQYAASSLSKADMLNNPILQFRRWFDQAAESGIVEPNAMSLATADAAGNATCRTVLLKAFDHRGFVFFTNYGSRKAKQIEQNPRVALLFTWLPLARQVEICGEAQKISTAESVRYFLGRPRGNCLGAWVSRQSSVISSRGVLTAKLEEMCRRFAGGEIPKPEGWGGYRVVPKTIEFWQGGTDRLHDRFNYVRQDGETWRVDRLSP